MGFWFRFAVLIMLLFIYATVAKPSDLFIGIMVVLFFAIAVVSESDSKVVVHCKEDK